ncbi:MAG: phage/plasmid primase, P4 family [Planctomycetia bacterium]|nr:phage/plasmid primase, P4 family [Planctomycetia bacterium]
MIAATNGHTTNGATPDWLKVNGDSIPAELKQREQWVGWRALPGKNGAKPRKMPYDPVNRRNASCDDPATWHRFEECWYPYLADPQRFAGIGFEFSADDEYAGIDLDKCRDADTGELHPTALQILATIKSYAEISPSGTGVKLIVKGKLPEGIKHKAAVDGIEIETYDQGRYFALTGHVVDAEHAEIIEAQQQLDAIVQQIQHAHSAKAQPQQSPKPGTGSDDRFRRALKRAISIKTGEENDGSRRLLKVCIIAVEMDLPDGDAFRLVAEVHRLVPFPSEFTEAEILLRLRDAEQKTIRGKSLNDAPQQQTSTGSSDIKLSLHFVDARTELANARRFIAKYGMRVVYCDPWKSWLVFNGRHWETDERRVIESLAKTEAAEQWDEVAKINKTEGAAEQLKQAVTAFARASNSANGIRNALALAKSEPGVPVLPKQLDAQPWLLNVENGTLDLRSGKLQPHRRDDLLTKLAPVVYDPAAECPQWLRFLDRIMDNKQSLVSFLQRSVGMSITGIVRDHCLLFCYGVGANGKSVFLNTIKRLMGDDYGLNAPPELLLVKPQGGGHPVETASLFGKRFVSAIEVDDGRRFAEATIKMLTGGDPITTRRMYENFWTFWPQHHIWVAGNHRPVIRGNDVGVWRRIKLIPFSVTIPPEEQDQELPEKLLGELSGILNWALQGVRDWLDYGLHEPAEVLAATSEYRADMDVFGDYLAERCDLNATSTIKASDLYADYRAWGDASGEYVMSQRGFGRKLTERGIERYTNNGTHYRGVDLRSRLEF